MASLESVQRRYVSPCILHTKLGRTLQCYSYYQSLSYFSASNDAETACLVPTIRFTSETRTINKRGSYLSLFDSLSHSQWGRVSVFPPTAQHIFYSSHVRLEWSFISPLSFALEMMAVQFSYGQVSSFTSGALLLVGFCSLSLLYHRVC